MENSLAESDSPLLIPKVARTNRTKTPESALVDAAEAVGGTARGPKAPSQRL